MFDHGLHLYGSCVAQKAVWIVIAQDLVSILGKWFGRSVFVGSSAGLFVLDLLFSIRASVVLRSSCFLFGLVLVLLVGCYSLREGRKAVDRIDIHDNVQVSAGDVRNSISTSSSSRFLGIWDGVVFDYAYYNRALIQDDLKRIERLYRARGFYEARVTAVRVIPTGKSGHVRVEIAVHEGPPTIVKKFETSGLDTLPTIEDRAAVINAIERGLSVGDRLDEVSYDDTKDRIRAVLRNRGFAWAEVGGQVRVDLLTSEALIKYEIVAGPRFRVRSVTFTGLEDLPKNFVERLVGIRGVPVHKVEQVLGVSAGDQFSAKELEVGKGALLDLGVFAGVNIFWTLGSPSPENTVPLDSDGKPAVDKNGEPAVDVVVTCTKVPLRAIKAGVGAELDTIRTDFHLVAGWEHRNFFGGLRRFSITAKPGIVLYPTRVNHITTPDHYLPEFKLLGSFRQPGFVDPRTAGFIRGNLSRFPVLLTSTDEMILGYWELTGAFGLERPFFYNHLSIETSLHGQANFPFTYVGELDDNLRRVFIRYLELVARVDYRDSALRPHKGFLFSNSLQFAGGYMGLGGSVTDIRVQPEMRVYTPLSSTVTFAVRTTFGFLFPQNYGRALEAGYREEDVRDQQLLFFRAFYSGGPSSNRGYPFRAVGPQGPGAFLTPNLSAAELRARCGRNYSKRECQIPLGGLTLWELSTEIRYPILGPLTGVVFADTSDVTRQQTTFHFDYLHLSMGAGLRYDTPVGPIRVDAGYRIPGMQRIGRETDERDPGKILKLPIAFSVAVGQAF